MDKINLIKSRINCIDYAKRIGCTISESGQRCISPLRPESDNRTSFCVREDYYFDFGDYTGGDVIDFCANYAHNSDKSAAIRELADITGVTDTGEYSNWLQSTKQLGDLVYLWHSQLRMQDYDYLHNRRITDETIERLKIGFTGKGIQHNQSAHYGANRISIPYWKNQYVFSYNLRATTADQKPKYLKRPNDSYSDTSAVWGMHTLNRTDNKFLVIAEGAFDALSFDQSGYTVLATMGGVFSQPQLKTVTDIAKNYDYVLLTFDNDTAGDSFSSKLSQYLFSHRIKFKVAHIPPKYKDISEYYAAGNELSDLPIEDGLQAMCATITDKDEFKKFATQISRYIAKPELADLFTTAKSTLVDCSSEWLAELRKVCFSAPSEDSIVKAVLAHHNLKYVDNVGFYEYKKGYWNFTADKFIKNYIQDELGNYRTGSKVSSILSLIQAQAITTIKFNTKPLFNFTNGTLDLTTLEFREHDPNDFMSMQVDYPYKPDTKSELWDKFIYDVADGDIRRMDLLQEIAGYILYPDCSLQSCAFLLGEGANGKSVYLETLEDLLPEKSTSKVELSGLTNDFQRIRFMHSLLNVAEETSTDVKGAESMFKQIVAGGSITACYKHQDFVDFTPRTKFIFACNDIPHFKDMSYGMERRMNFVRFVNKFKKAPNKSNPHEFQADLELHDKLVEPKEKSAIFNWILEGYKNLHIFGEFTETDDCEELKQNFRETINPVSVFLSEVDISEHLQFGSISNAALYELYTNWCAESGHKPKARNTFCKEFRRLTENIYEIYRTKTEKGFRIPREEKEVVFNFPSKR